MKQYIALEKKLEYGDYYSLLKFCDMLDQNVINECDGYGELVYVNNNGQLFVDENSDAIGDLCNTKSTAYQDEDGMYLVGALWYNS